MTNRAQVVATARSWLGTPFHHQARQRGVGVDCVGLVIGVARELALVASDFDVTGYARVPDGVSFMLLAATYMTPIARTAMQAGDVVALSFDQDAQHFGVLGPYAHGGLSIIHAASRSGRVIETRLLFGADMHFVAAFALPGVA